MADGATITPESAAAELLRRRRARISLVDYSQAIEIPGAPVSEDEDAWLFKPIETTVALHQRVMMEWIQECIETDFGRLMIFAPPGSAKSSYAAVVAPTWAMGRYPGTRVLATSYAGKPIIRASKKGRQICASDLYRNIWEQETTIPNGSNAADEWELTNGSGLFAAGLLGGITSSRCDLGIIDDPVAGREEAESETIRKKTIDAYRDDFLTRLKPNASIILIQTRWHEDDLAGSILPEDWKGESGYIECRDGQTWRVLCIPAECDRTDDPLGRKIGDFLWPEWFSPRHWSIFKKIARTWSSLFQQKPTPDDGIYFHRADILRHRAGTEPEGCTKYLSSDFATKDDAGDFTVHGVVNIGADSRIWIAGGWRGQKETDKTIARAIDLIEEHEPVYWLGESGPIESSIGPDIKRQMRKRQKYAARLLMPSIANKVQRARGIMGRVSAGEVSIVEGPWGDQLVEELIAFPGGRYDDGVDMMSLIGRAIDKLLDGHETASEDPAEKMRNEPFRRRHIEGRTRKDAEFEREKSDRAKAYR